MRMRRRNSARGVVVDKDAIKYGFDDFKREMSDVHYMLSRLRFNPLAQALVLSSIRRNQLMLPTPPPPPDTLVSLKYPLDKKTVVMPMVSGGDVQPNGHNT